MNQTLKGNYLTFTFLQYPQFLNEFQLVQILYKENCKNYEKGEIQAQKSFTCLPLNKDKKKDTGFCMCLCISSGRTFK